MIKEFESSVYLMGRPGITYDADEYIYPPAYTIGQVHITDYRAASAEALANFIVGNVSAAEFFRVFNSPARVVLLDQLVIALYDTVAAPTTRFIIDTDFVGDLVPAQTYHWIHAGPGYYMGIYKLPNKGSK